MAAALSAHTQAWNIRQNAEINVTPFVDVMLVLLIIFMVALPVSTVSVKVDLPQTEASPDRVVPPVIVSLALDGGVYVGDRPTSLADLPGIAAAALGPRPTEQRIYLRADKGVSYGALMAVMNRLHASGFDRVALMSEQL